MTYYDEPDFGESDGDMNENANFSYQASYDSSFDKSAEDCNGCLKDRNLNSKSFKTFVNPTFYDKRTSSDIDLLRISALNSISKDRIVCKSAECLLNDYGDTETVDQRKKQRSCEMLDTNFEAYERVNISGTKINKRGHLRSKSAFGVKDIVKENASLRNKDREKLGKIKTETDVPRIAVTQYSPKYGSRKSQTFPRTFDSSKFGQMSDINTNPNFDEKKSKRTKRDKISQIFSSGGGEKREKMRYGLQGII